MAQKLALALLAVVLAVGFAADADAQKKGGVLRVGIIGEPPALDAHWTTAAVTANMGAHLYEGLYTLDDNRRPYPMLAEALPTVSRDGLTYTIKLRQGRQVPHRQGDDLGRRGRLTSAMGPAVGVRARAFRAGRRLSGRWTGTRWNSSSRSPPCSS